MLLKCNVAISQVVCAAFSGKTNETKMSKKFLSHEEDLVQDSMQYIKLLFVSRAENSKVSISLYVL